MASGDFLKNINSAVSKSGGTQENLNLDFVREKLTLKDYQENWGDFIRDAAEHTEECGKDCEHTKERKMICRMHGNSWRIKLVRQGIVVPIGGHTDMLIPDKSDALSMLDMIAVGFEDGNLDDELKAWMSTRDENVEKAKKAKESKDKSKKKRADRKSDRGTSDTRVKKLPSRKR